jgi:hypothetical protein
MTPLEVSYTVRRSDVVWMYLGSWAARMLLIPGILCILFGLPTNPKYMTAELLFMVFGVVCLVGAPLLLSRMLMSMYGTDRLVGTSVQLKIDDRGIRGWPLAADMDTSWPRVRRARRLRGVITVPFRQFGTRAGWVPIPERALSSGQLETLRLLLKAKGLL